MLVRIVRGANSTAYSMGSRRTQLRQQLCQRVWMDVPTEESR